MFTLLKRMFDGGRQAVRRVLAGDVGAIMMVVCLSIGLAVNATAFTVFSAVLLRPLQFPDEERLVLVFERHPTRGRMAVTPGNFVDWQNRSKSFERVTAFLDSDFALTGHGEPLRVRGQEVIRDFFQVYGVPALVGAVFQGEHYAAGASHVTVISHGLWQEAFGGDPGVVGRTVEIDARPYRIIGVMPRSFELWDIDLWIPWVPEPALWTERRFHYFPTLARLKSGVPIEQAQAELSTIYAALELESPQTNAEWRPEIEPLRQFVFGDSLRNTAAILQVAVLVVLAIACINSMFLIAARTLERHRETIVRVALGATRFDRAAETIGETLALNVIAITLGLAAAYWMVRFIAPFALPTDVPIAFGIQFDLSTLAFVIGLSLLINVCLAAPPLWRSWVDDRSMASQLGRELTEQRSKGRQRLLLLHVAFTTLLVVVATVMIRVEATLAGSPVGFDAEQLVVSDIAVPEARYRTAAEVAAFARTLVERVSALPGVIGAATTSYVPLTAPTATWRFTVTGRPPTSTADDCSARPIVVSKEFFRTLRVPVVGGRVFSDSDGASAERAAVITGVAAQSCWGSSDPLGSRIVVNGLTAPFIIVGTVGDIATGQLAGSREPTIYVSQEQVPRREISLVARTTSSPLELIPLIRDTVRSMDDHLPVSRIQTLGDIRAALLAQPRFRRSVMSVFALIALTLSALGLYATSMHSVLSRINELGVRSALGARQGQLTMLLLSECFAYAAAGVILGAIGAAWLTRLLEGVNVGIERAGLGALSIAAIVVCASTLAATYWPIRRYGKADPASLLRRA